ncbi:hypothetical protein Pmar_PMAR009197 [Perkinsus marinus ATCC 50983]|uniref:RNase H type-1 domain-containing protein n=1 Tax=Perkinsus marinus (strain ATCC 50983 / TXsc) TaxID=423536 RepID=C5LE21_PERM5|nr:hypothetical protein Pmar_PMAR009197 [Perkinsus marinus ATCC 50983]EER05019.1 hypothetical protein Pmar_PMAR009197 [Perkinsus marinus ATCC 50983]|eukprot:XP_002773203.1 hypothetical protein Pmar_PMAR009197 [Perkinsus marinus ATCC 50983]
MGSTGAAFISVSPTGRQTACSYKLHPDCSIFQAELSAVDKAIAFAMATAEEYGPSTEVIILSDSQVVLKSLTPAKQTALSIAIRRRYQHCEASGIYVTFAWVGAHFGVHYNERMDELANEGRSRGVPEDIPLPETATKQILSRSKPGEPLNRPVTTRSESTINA